MKNRAKRLALSFMLLVLVFIVTPAAWGAKYKNLWDAAKTGTANDVKNLIRAGANVNAQNKKGDTALIIAARSNPKPDIFVALLDAGANPNISNNHGATPLTAIVYYHPSVKITKLLLEAGADVNAVDKDGDTPLTNAILSKSASAATVEALLDAGADVYVKNKKGQSALTLAKKPEIVAVLQNAGYTAASRPAPSSTPTQTQPRPAAKIAKNENSGNGRVARDIFEAIRKNSAKDVVYAIRAGANINARMNKGDLQDMTPLIYAAAINASPEILSELLNAGADVNAVAVQNVGNLLRYKVTPLILAAGVTSSPEVISILLRTGTKMPSQTSAALSRAVLKSKPSAKIIDILMSNGADVNFSMNYVGVLGVMPESILMTAASNEDITPEIIKKLVRAGARMEDTSSIGDTPLLMAVKKLNVDAVEALIKLGANVNAQNNSGETALFLAEKKIPGDGIFGSLMNLTPEARNAKKIVELLEDAGAYF